MYNHFLKLSSVFFIVFISFSIQSCKTYDMESVPESEAIASADKVRVITTDGKAYNLKKLLVDDDQLVGISKPKSKAAIYLPSETFIDSKGHTMEKVAIDRTTVKELKVEVLNKKKSRRRTILLIVIPLGLVLAAGAGTAVLIASA